MGSDKVKLSKAERQQSSAERQVSRLDDDLREARQGVVNDAAQLKGRAKQDADDHAAKLKSLKSKLKNVQKESGKAEKKLREVGKDIRSTEHAGQMKVSKLRNEGAKKRRKEEAKVAADEQSKAELEGKVKQLKMTKEMEDRKAAQARKETIKLAAESEAQSNNDAEKLDAEKAKRADDKRKLE